MRSLLASAWPAIRTIVFDLGGAITFWILLKTAGLKPALAGTIVFVAFDVWRRRRFGIGFPRIYVLTTSLVVLFGAIDLASRKPFMLRYEGAVSAFLVGCFFVFGARGRSVLEELMTAQAGDAALEMPHARRFYQLFTLTWAFYFFAMSGFYLWISLHYPYLKAIGIRQVAGLVGIGVMMLVSVNMNRLHGGFRRLGLLPAG